MECKRLGWQTPAARPSLFCQTWNLVFLCSQLPTNYHGAPQFVEGFFGGAADKGYSAEEDCSPTTLQLKVSLACRTTSSRRILQQTNLLNGNRESRVTNRKALGGPPAGFNARPILVLQSKSPRFEVHKLAQTILNSPGVVCLNLRRLAQKQAARPQPTLKQSLTVKDRDRRGKREE